MKQNVYEAIKLIEQVTASRFYTERGRNALIETVAYAMFLSAEEKYKVTAAQQTQYVNLQEVRNALLLLVGIRHSEEAGAVLKARAEVLDAHQRTQLPYYDKSGWLVYVHGADDGAARDDAQFEVACFLCATNHEEEAYAKFVRLSKNGNLSALWLALGLARKLGKTEDEARLLSELNSLYEEGVLDYLPDEAAARMHDLQKQGYQCTASTGYGKNKIGF